MSRTKYRTWHRAAFRRERDSIEAWQHSVGSDRAQKYRGRRGIDGDSEAIRKRERWVQQARRRPGAALDGVPCPSPIPTAARDERVHMRVLPSRCHPLLQEGHPVSRLLVHGEAITLHSRGRCPGRGHLPDDSRAVSAQALPPSQPDHSRCPRPGSAQSAGQTCQFRLPLEHSTEKDGTFRGVSPEVRCVPHHGLSLAGKKSPHQASNVFGSEAEALGKEG